MFDPQRSSHGKRISDLRSFQECRPDTGPVTDLGQAGRSMARRFFQLFNSAIKVIYAFDKVKVRNSE